MRDRTVHLFILTHLVFLLGVFFIHYTTSLKEAQVNEQIALLNALVHDEKAIIDTDEEMLDAPADSFESKPLQSSETFITETLPIGPIISYRLVWV